ncbi:MAG TPA: hypothetical protein VNK04_14305 [Gemmataceae bacterium]|nr:hypothetical protein [Gemmataceae bacterium]
MDTTRPTSSLPAADKTQQSDLQSDLEALSERAQGIVRRAGWLSKDEHLARLDRLLEDRLTRRSQLALVESEYRQALDERIREKTEARPFMDPALDEKIAFYRQLLQALEAYDDRFIRLKVQLNDHRLESSHRELIQRCRRSRKNAKRCANCQAYRNTPMWEKFYRDAIKKDPHWGQALTLFRDYLQRLEKERVRLEAAHADKIRSEAEAELGLVAALARSVRESCLKADVRDEYLEKVLDLLLALPANDPLILDDEVHLLLEQAEDRLARRACITAPVLIAYIGRLITREQYKRASELLDHLVVAEGSPEAAVVAYLHYVVSDPPDLAGVTCYSSLSAEDVFLGACYYEAFYAGKRGPASATLRDQREWDYRLLEASLLRAGGEETHQLNSFKVYGLQPRIAELAFHQIFTQLHGADASSGLRDLNLEKVRQLAPPWRLDARPALPPADWESQDKRQYDVKCNLFLRSERKRVGLRGLLINRSKVSAQSFPGFVFTDTDDDSCSWVYVGEYEPAPGIEQVGDRILPFWFRLPDSMRYAPSIDKTGFELGMRLLQGPWLPMGWQLACRQKATLPQGPRTVRELLFDQLIDNCLRDMEGRGTCLEVALWEALTKTTFDACSRWDRDSVDSYLGLTAQLLENRALPVRLPRGDGTPLLCSWIEQVLRPLNKHWDKIKCPNCGARGSQPGGIKLSAMVMTSGGTIYGALACSRCGLVRDKATLLAHCYECSHYPLIIGKNPVCKTCNRLVCEWVNQKGVQCKCCKEGCVGGQQTPEEDFA